MEYDRGLLTGASLLAMFVLIAAGGTLYLNRALRVAAEQRVSFVNRVSHELKSP
ncbi:MAG: hypothetical protein H7A53_07415 [Akkermansiaceae bacterium]|nr:hypothetical protein [Akkermansiaceae bacterium]